MSGTPKLNVLLVVPWDQESGGVASVVGSLARHLDGEGHRVLFLHPGASETIRPRTTKWGFRGVELNLRTPFVPGRGVRSVIAFLLTLPFRLFQLIRLLRANDIRVINIHYPGDAFVPLAFCRWLLPLRLVISVHGMDMIRWDEPAARLPLALRVLFAAADLVIAPSRHFIQRCEAKIGSYSARRIAIHNGVDVSELENDAAGSAALHQPFVLSVSSLDAWKGLDVLIRAMALLRDEGETTPLVLAGEGPARSELERLIAELGLEQQVLLIGQQSRRSIARLLHECTVFVLPSRFESFGIAVIEALACGKAVVGTRVDGILEIIEDGTTGLLTEPEDAAGLASAIRRLLGDGALRERVGSAGRTSVKDRFRWQRMGENYTRAFGEVLQHGA